MKQGGCGAWLPLLLLAAHALLAPTGSRTRDRISQPRTRDRISQPRTRDRISQPRTRDRISQPRTRDRISQPLAHGHVALCQCSVPHAPRSSLR
eukprot:897696-Rhodomonas_salina.6